MKGLSYKAPQTIDTVRGLSVVGTRFEKRGGALGGGWRWGGDTAIVYVEDNVRVRAVNTDILKKLLIIPVPQ